MRDKWPFYKDTYYKGELSYSYKRHMWKYKWSSYQGIKRIRVGNMSDFIVYPNYAMLIKRVNSRRPIR